MDSFPPDADILLHQRSLLPAVRLCKQILDLHSREVNWLEAEEFTRHLVSDQDPGGLGVNGDDGLVRVPCCRGKEGKLVATPNPAHWRGALDIRDGEGGVETLGEGSYEGPSYK